MASMSEKGLEFGQRLSCVLVAPKCERERGPGRWKKGCEVLFCTYLRLGLFKVLVAQPQWHDG